MSNWHTMDTAEALKALDVDFETGLKPAEAERRLAETGPNELVERGGESPLKILFEQFTSLLVIVLIAAAFVSGAVLGEWADAAVIMVIVLLNAGLGFRQEFKAEKAMAALKKLTAPRVRIRRGGQLQEIPSTQLVPGDVVYLEAGNLVPADCRLLEVAALRVEEASLTGESLPVTKQTEAIEEPSTPLGDRRNMVYMGTVLTYGRGVAVVASTGMQTELGKIAHRLQTVEDEDTPLQKQLSKLGKVLVGAALLLIALVGTIGFLRGQDLETVFLTAVSMAVAAVPEGLPAVVTIALALGAQRMLARHALIRKLPAVETLGAVTTICSDKTGTLTQNRMTVTLFQLPDALISLEDKEKPEVIREHPETAILFANGALCSDAVLRHDRDAHGKLQALGDPTEGALVIAAAQADLAKSALEEVLPRVAEVPFDSERKRMTTVHRLPGDPEALPQVLAAVLREPLYGAGGKVTHLAFCKGATDGVLDISTHLFKDGKIEPLSPNRKEELSRINANLASDGIRVLGMALRPLSALPQDSMRTVEQSFVFVGMTGMVDPVRPEVRDAVATCVSAGIRSVMITGDHPLMARYIARKLAMLPADEKTADNGPASTLTGRDLEKMTEDDLKEVVEKVSVYARVAPEHKLNIVDALQARGHVCAMTGDGVNDAPALKSADIGVAMGITGTDVSKEASDMVLQDDNFATIVFAVEEGRTIFGNIRKFIRYLLACNTGELWLFLIAPFLGMPLPLLPVQILWMNLVTDGFPALGLGVEPPERDIMTRPPRDPKAFILGWSQGAHIIWVGLLIAVLAMAMGYFYWNAAGAPASAGGHGHGGTASTWQTMLFCTMVFAQIFLAFAERSDRASLFTIGLMSNPYMLLAVGGTFLLQLGVVYIPFAQSIFKTVPLTASELAISVLVGLAAFFAVEIEKGIKRLHGSAPA